MNADERMPDLERQWAWLGILGETPCPSTHGGAGYCLGSYWDGDAIVCGACGARIEQPPPGGRRFVRDPGWWAWLLGRGRWEPIWPDFIGGEQARRRADGIPEERGGE